MKMNRIRILIILISGFFSWTLTLPAWSQMISVSSSLNRDTIMIGEQLDYTLQIEKEKGIQASFPVFKDTLTGKIEIVGDAGMDSSETDGKEKVRRLLRITSFEEGMVMIPPQAITFTGEGISDTVYSTPLYLLVLAPDVDTTQAIRPIKPPVFTPVSPEEVLPWFVRGLLILAILSLIIAVIWILTHRERFSELFSPVKEEPAHVIAFRELDRLKEEKLPESGRVKEFYSRLTEIIRRYMERQYMIPAMETTTLEILSMFSRNNPDDPMLDDMLKNLLELGDLVKFAKGEPLPVENQTNLNNAYFFVQKTYPRFMEPGSEEKEKDQDVESEDTLLRDE